MPSSIRRTPAAILSRSIFAFFLGNVGFRLFSFVCFNGHDRFGKAKFLFEFNSSVGKQFLHFVYGQKIKIRYRSLDPKYVRRLKDRNKYLTRNHADKWKPRVAFNGKRTAWRLNKILPPGPYNLDGKTLLLFP